MILILILKVLYGDGRGAEDRSGISEEEGEVDSRVVSQLLEFALSRGHSSEVEVFEAQVDNDFINAVDSC